MIKIDNETFNVGIVSVERQVSQNKISRGTTLDGIKHYDVLGTYYDYTITFNPKSMSLSEYDRLYEKITEPKEYFVVEVPYGQTTITFKANLSVGNDRMVSNYTNARKWGSLSVTFEALEPQKVVQQ